MTPLPDWMEGPFRKTKPVRRCWLRVLFDDFLRFISAPSPLLINPTSPTRRPEMEFTFTAVGHSYNDAASFFNDMLRDRAAPAVITERAVPRIGERWDEQHGHNMGWFKGVNGPDYLLILPDSRAERSGLEWGSHGDEEPGAQCEFDGLANTKALLAGGRSHPAIEWAKGFELDGHTDLYVPSRRELRQCWINGDALFNKDAYYWSSTQYSRYDAWCQDGAYGYQGAYYEYYKFAVRLIRRFIP